VANDYDRARDYAVRYLGYRSCTTKRLREKMKEKEFSPESIDSVVCLFTEKGYLNDIAYAQSYINSKTRINNYGQRRIVVGLMQKGISKNDIQAAYAAILERNGEDAQNETEIDAAKRALTKRLARKDIDSILSDHNEKQKLAAYLMRRGFSYNIVKTAMQSLEENE